MPRTSPVTTLVLILALSLGASSATADDHEIPSTKLKIGGKARGGKIISALMVEPTETDGIPTCTPNDHVFFGRWPKPLKFQAVKRYRAKIVISTSRMPETLEVERRVHKYPPPGSIEGKPIPHTLVSAGSGNGFVIKFRVRVPRPDLYVQLTAEWPDEGECEGDFATYGWVLRARG